MLPLTIIIFIIVKVDKHIRKLDADLARFESDLKEQHAKEAGYSDYESEILYLFYNHLTGVILNTYCSQFSLSIKGPASFT